MFATCSAVSSTLCQFRRQLLANASIAAPRVASRVSAASYAAGGGGGGFGGLGGGGFGGLDGNIGLPVFDLSAPAAA